MSTASPTPAERLSAILQRMMRDVAARSKGGVLPGPLILLIWQLISRINQTFTALVLRIRAGHYRPRRPFTRKLAKDPKPRPPNPLPQRFGWLLPLMPKLPAELMLHGSGGAYRREVQQLFDDPEMQALIASAPVAMARVLRPLCRMLGLRPPVRARRPAPDPLPAAQAARSPTPPAADPPAPRPDHPPPQPHPDESPPETA